MTHEDITTDRRLSDRRPVSADVWAGVRLCRGGAARARIVDEQGGSLGLRFEGTEAERALAHRLCCRGKPITLVLPGDGQVLRDIPARLVHVTEHGQGASGGASFLVACLDGADVKHLSALWSRLHGANGSA